MADFFHQDPLLPDKLGKILKNLAIFKKVRKHFWVHAFIETTPNGNGVYSGLRPIIHPSFKEIRTVVFV